MDSAAATPTSITQTSISYDTLLVRAVFTGLSAGSHSLGFTIYDAPNWQYHSSLDTFSIRQTLPVGETKLTGKAVSCHAELSWTVNNESHVTGYEVQQSLDGTNYKSVETLIPEGKTGMDDYHVSIEQFSIPTAYYRLKLITNDGKTGYSNVLNIKGDCIYDEGLSVYPNPAHESIKVKYISNNLPQNGSIQLVDVHGKQVYGQRCLLQQGNNRFVIDLKGINDGTYLLFIKRSDNLCAKKVLVVQR